MEPDVHQQIMEILEEPHAAVDREARIRDVFCKDFGRLLVYARIDDGKARPMTVWWGESLEARPGHVETLDDIFCALEKELSALRRAVKKYAPDFLEARGRKLPCGVR